MPPRRCRPAPGASAPAAVARRSPRLRRPRDRPRAERRQGALRMIPCRYRFVHRRGAVCVQSGQEDGALDLGARHVRRVVDRGQCSCAVNRDGGRPSWPSTTAPIRSSGTMMRRIGRRLSEASPVSVVLNGWAARIPASMRIVLPEFPASSVPAGAANPRMPRPSMRSSRPFGPGVEVMLTPSRRGN